MAFDGQAFQPRAIDFLGVEFTNLDRDAALDAIAVRASIGAPFAYVATPNVDHVVGLSNEPARTALYEQAWLTLNDSKVLQRLAKRAKIKLPTTPGADLAQALFETVIDPSEPITIIGADADLIQTLKRRYKLTDVRWHAPPKGVKLKPGAIVDAAAFAAAQQSRFTFLCVGAPQQEMIAYAIKQRGDAIGVGLCVGASIEFLAGRKSRAPKWLRAVGFEWAFRLASEPSRMWRRYLVDGPKVFALFSEWRAAMAAASAA